MKMMMIKTPIWIFLMETKMKKNILLSILSIFLLENIFSENTENIKNFVKGNLSEKTAAVKAATKDDVEELSKRAIDFSIENKEILGEDRELAALAVSGILAVPSDFVDALEEPEKEKISDNLLNLYNLFNDETVKIAVLNKISKLNISTEKFKESLNSYLSNCNPETENKLILISSIQTVGTIGDADSFNILLGNIQKNEWQPYQNETEKALGQLCVKAEKELIEIIGKGNVSECRKIFEFVLKNQKNNQIFCAKISESVLARTIYIYENSGSASEEMISLQIDSFCVLRDLKWTRAAATTIKFFDIAVKEFEDSQMSEKNFCLVIEGIAETSPIESVSKLSAYLSVQNKSMEKENSKVSEPVVLSLIKTLGAIGDKNAFDSLLAVAYYNYSDTVIAEAREALAKLKW